MSNKTATKMTETAPSESHEPDRNKTKSKTMTSANATKNIDETGPTENTSSPKPKKTKKNTEESDSSTPGSPKSVLKITRYHLRKSAASTRKPKKWKCMKCGHSVSSKEDLKSHHEAKHTGVMCSVCNKICATDKSLCKHGYQHIQQSYHCELCNKYFMFPSELDGHMITHDKTPQLSCNIIGCNKNYFRKSKLNAHILTHEGNVWKCDHAECTYEAIDK